MKKKIVLIGGGGHCLSCIDVIERGGEFKIVGIVDKDEAAAGNVSAYPYLGGDYEIESLARKYGLFLIAVGFIDSPRARIRLFERAREAGGTFPVIVSPPAVVSNNARIGAGTIVMHNAVINSGAVVGVNSIINTAAVVEHDTIVGDHCHISTTAVLNGNCVIGNRVFVGSNTTVFHGVRIRDDVIVGAGSVVHKDLEKPGVYVGNPLRRVGNPAHE